MDKTKNKDQGTDDRTKELAQDLSKDSKSLDNGLVKEDMKKKESIGNEFFSNPQLQKQLLKHKYSMEQTQSNQPKPLSLKQIGSRFSISYNPEKRNIIQNLLVSNNKLNPENDSLDETIMNLQVKMNHGKKEEGKDKLLRENQLLKMIQ